MKAMQFREFGSARKVFWQVDIPTPVPNPEEVLVNVHAASINPVDVKHRSGAYGQTLTQPIIPGYDFSGVVERVGTKTRGWKTGDAVYGTGADPSGRGGTNAEYVLVDYRSLAYKPTLLSFEDAAALPLVGVTAWEALFDKLNLQEHEDILIQAGTGGVGGMAVQLAKWKGATVYATVSSKVKEAAVSALGAIPINYKISDVIDFSHQINAGQGFSKIFDTVGRATFIQSLAVLRPYGQVCSIVGSFSSDLNLEGAAYKNLTLHFTMMLLPTRLHLPERIRHQSDILTKIAELADQGVLRPRVDKIFNLSDVASAHEYMESGKHLGKIVLKII